MSDVLTPTLTQPIVDFLKSRLALYAQGSQPAVYTPAALLAEGGQETLLKQAGARAGDAAKPGNTVEAIELAMEDAHTAMALGRDAEHARAGRLDILAAYANDLSVGLEPVGALAGLLRIGAERGDA